MKPVPASGHAAIDTARLRNRSPARLLARIPIPAGWVNAWDRLSMRERRLATAAAVVVLFAAAWALLWQPLKDDTLRARRELLLARTALSAAQAQTAELTGLQRITPTPESTDPRVAVEQVLGERGLKSVLTSLDVKDTRVFVTFADIGFDPLVSLLDALARTHGLRAVEATLTSRIDPGSVRAEITLAR
ncbi:MAG: type II secretion system protein GspM [Betaproteobacteria bacterium]